MATYNRYSPYANAEQTWHLGSYVHLSVPPASDDEYRTISNDMSQQPWRLAKELYGNERLFYIFANANMDKIKDPVYDFKAGVTIRVPTNDRVQRLLGGR